jgi:hypothetical protein
MWEERAGPTAFGLGALLSLGGDSWLMLEEPPTAPAQEAFWEPTPTPAVDALSPLRMGLCGL